MVSEDLLLGTLKYGITLSIHPYDDRRFIMFVFKHPDIEKGHVTMYTKKSINEEGIDKLYEKLEKSLNNYVNTYKLDREE